MNSPQKTARIAACIFLGIFFLGMAKVEEGFMIELLGKNTSLIKSAPRE